MCAISIPNEESYPKAAKIIYINANFIGCHVKML